MTIDEVIKNALPQDIRFQPALADFIFDHKLETIVETGSGLSTAFILQALDKLGKGHLYSIDPRPYCEFEIEHPRYTLIKKKSFQALGDLYKQTGQWDLFLHDSDHWIETQMFEYEVAISVVRQKGFIFSDDYQWGGHGAWKRFCHKHHLLPISVGDIQGVQKTAQGILPNDIIQTYINHQWRKAKRFGKKWRMLNAQPPCWSCEEEVTEYWKYPDKV